jgi:hypothetical protein
MAQSLGAAAAQDLIVQSVRALANDAAAKKATPVVEAAFELVRQSSKLGGRRTLAITGITVHAGEDVEGSGSTSVARTGGTTGKGRQTSGGGGPTGGMQYACFEVWPSPRVMACVYWK